MTEKEKWDEMNDLRRREQVKFSYEAGRESRQAEIDELKKQVSDLKALPHPSIRMMLETISESLPDNPVWHKDPRLFEAYCAGRNDMLAAGYRRVANPDSSILVLLKKAQEGK